jgi:hypothetical protein
MQEYKAGMQLPDILQLIAVIVEAAVAVLSVLIAVKKKKIYGWCIAVTFALFVIFDISRIFLLPLSDTVHALVFLVACVSMLYAVWLMYTEKCVREIWDRGDVPPSPCQEVRPGYGSGSLEVPSGPGNRSRRWHSTQSRIPSYRNVWGGGGQDTDGREVPWQILLGSPAINPHG